MTSGRSKPVYVYAVVSGRPSSRLVSQLPSLPEGSPPRILPLDNTISLIVADVSPQIYNRESLKDRLADLDWVSRAGAAHHSVADALVESHVVLPLRVFTLFSSEAKTLATLRQSKRQITKTLARVKGRHEWVLRIGKPDPARLPATDSPSATSEKSGTTFLRRKADARREQAERAARTGAAATKVFDALREIADDATSRPVEPGLNLLLDAAFLVSKRRTDALRKRLTETAAGLLNDGCPVSLTGPWPPYSFVEVQSARFRVQS